MYMHIMHVNYVNYKAAKTYILINIYDIHYSQI